MTQLYRSWVLVQDTQFINCPDTSTSLFMAALFIISKSRSQPRCQTSEGRTRKSNKWAPGIVFRQEERSLVICRKIDTIGDNHVITESNIPCALSFVGPGLYVAT